LKLKPEQDLDRYPDRYKDPVYLRKTAMDYLARREHSEQELTRKLTVRGFGEVLIETALAELVTDGLQSDARFAEAFVNSRFQWQRVRDVREKKFGADLPGDFKERSRQMRFLQQRGFTSEQISGAFKDE